MEDVKQRKEDSRRETDINNTKIKYILVTDTKIYKVKDIDFHNLTIEATETNLPIADVAESELWDIAEFRDYKVKLINNGGQADIVDFDDWIKERNLKE